MFRRSGRLAVKVKNGGKWPTVTVEKKPKALRVKEFNKTEKRTIHPKGARHYPTEKPNRPARKQNHNPSKLRKSITPGTVLIVLSGRFRGKRVVFLKQFQPSGLLLVTGPFKINGVPLRRINQAYVIATSTHVDLADLKVPSKLDDAYFRKPKTVKKAKTEENFFAGGKTEKKKKVVDAARVTDQKEVDTQVLEAVKKVPHLKEYLNAKFTLSKRQYPHLLKF